MEITPATIPGIGIVHQCRTRHGHRLAVIQHHDGRRELIAYPPAPAAARLPDARAARDDVGLAVRLDPDEADQLAELLLSRTVADRLTAVERRLAQLTGR